MCGEANINLIRSSFGSLIYFECSILFVPYLLISIFFLNYLYFWSKKEEWTSGVSDWSHAQVSSRRTWLNLPCGKTAAHVLSNPKQLLCPNQSAVPCLVGVGKLGCRTAVPLTPRIWRALHERGPAHLLACLGENSLIFGANMNTQWWINTLLRTKVIEEAVIKPALWVSSWKWKGHVDEPSKHQSVWEIF